MFESSMFTQTTFVNLEGTQHIVFLASMNKTKFFSGDWIKIEVCLKFLITQLAR